MGKFRGSDIFLVFPLWMLAATAASVWQSRPEILAAAAVGALAVRTLRAGRIALGWANALTWLRIGATAGLVWLEPSSLSLCLLAFGVFALDGADGAVARALGTESAIGADLDKECDAFFVLMAGMLLWAQGSAGAWVLIPGAWRYVYSLVVALFDELRPAPRSNWARYSYSTSCLCLIAALWEKAPAPASLALVATILISASFLRSLYYCLPRS